MKNKNQKMKQLVRGLRTVMISASMIFVTVIGGAQLHAAAGDNGDFVAGQVPPASTANASNYFMIPGQSNTFFHPDYSNVITLNQNTQNQQGATWSTNKVSLTGAFDYKANLYVGASQGRGMGSASGMTGGDGITFTMHNDPRGHEAIGGYGHALGAYFRSGSSGGIQNAISFEYDAYPQLYDTGTGDLLSTNEYKHTAFVKPTDPNGYAKHYDLKLISEYDDAQGDIQSRWVPLDAHWEPNADGSGVLTMSLNGVSSSYYIADYVSYFNGDSVYFGYTGGTGTATELQAIALVEMPNFIYQVDYDLNAPVGEVAAIASEQVESGSLIPGVTDPVRSNYTFGGWYTSLNFNDNEKWDFSQDVMPESDITLYAKWDEIKYDVNFDVNGGEDAGILTQRHALGSYLDGVNVPTRLGYDFIGWNELADGSGIYWDFATNTTPANDMTLYAQWQLSNYTIDYVLDGGINSINNPQMYQYLEGVDAFEEPTKVGYIFMGWFDQATGGSQIQNIDSNETGNKTLYAQWMKIEDKIISDVQGNNPSFMEKSAASTPVNTTNIVTTNDTSKPIQILLVLGGASLLTLFIIGRKKKAK